MGEHGLERLSTHRRPAFTAHDAVRLAKELYGISGEAMELASDRDQNFLIEESAGGRFVLKLSNEAEDRAHLDLQVRALHHLADAHTGYVFPRPHASQSGEWIASAEDREGRAFLARMQTFVPGAVLADVRPRTAELFRGLGHMLGTMDAALKGFSHPALHRRFDWDLQHAADVARSHLAHVVGSERRSRLDRVLESVEARLEPFLPELRRSPIHNDGNDHNVLVTWPTGPHGPTDSRRILGIVDFGDMVHSYTVAELAIAVAYAMLDAPDPLAVAAAALAGYQSVHLLTEVEIAALFPLIELRLALSVGMSAFQKRREPDNDYLTISEAPAWALLERLERTNGDLAHYVLRDACGLPGCPAHAAVIEWLAEHQTEFAPVVAPSPRTVRTLVFDLGVGGRELVSIPAGAGAGAWTDHLFRRMAEAGADVGIGKYDEVRRWYTSDLFRVAGGERPEWRTVHLGADLFQPPGSAVLAPLGGTVHSFANNTGELDYGPTVVLEHVVADGRIRFFTLYGHLSEASLEGLSRGDAVARGERIGDLGDHPANGGWAPHLHFQIILDMLGHEGDFPGVAAPSQRRVWRSVSPDPNLILAIPDLASGDEGMAREDLVRARARALGPSLSVSYRKPLKIVRGWRQYLYDELGQPYLDGVNNVAHVGHCHPRVVDALARQAGVLNTNTRYLHDDLVRYAERLAGTMPDPLSVCFLVCSGSEANELALRMARAHSGRRDVIVVEGGYHGNTTSLVEISPYKFDGPGGTGAPPYVHSVVMPDPYRGPYRRFDLDAGGKYAAHVGEAVKDAGRSGGVGAFFCESLLGCGGQIVLPPGYLQTAFEVVREAGGVCVADEVQVGFGRVGTHFWGFETQGVVPDIVTMGKPIGNGHPLGAVFTTPEIAASFDTGMEYFNTFGGNPVSCAVGLAVLDVIEEEQLQRNAQQVGERLLRGLQGLMVEHDVIGDVRGLGLFVGVELVLDRHTLEPAPELASHAVNRLREKGILLSTDGPFHNVLKIKPPLVFTEANADRLVATLDVVLGEDEFRMRAGERA